MRAAEARLPGGTPAKTAGAVVDDGRDAAGGHHGARGNGVAEDGSSALTGVGEEEGGAALLSLLREWWR